MDEFRGDTIEENLFGEVSNDIVVEDPAIIDLQGDNSYDISVDPYELSGVDIGDLSTTEESYYPQEGVPLYDSATILVVDSEPILSNDSFVEMDPVVIDEVDHVVPDNIQGSTNETFDDKNILKSLSTVRDAIKLGNTNETEYSVEVIDYLDKINNNQIYTNYLLAVIIGMIVIKTIFDKVMP